MARMTHLIDGKQISQEIKDELKQEVSRLKAEGIAYLPGCCSGGSDPASSVYVRQQEKGMRLYRGRIQII